MATHRQPSTTPSFRKRALAAVVAAIVALMIAILPQGIWSALITLNLRTSPTIPWAEVVMTGLLILQWQYLGGRFPPRRTSEARRRHLRASRVPVPMFAWAVLAGALAVVALTGVWIILAQIIRMPGTFCLRWGTCPGRSSRWQLAWVP